MMNLVWFRNDYRLDDHPALYAAVQANQPFTAITFFPKPTTFFGLQNPSNTRAQAVYTAIESLHQRLEKLGVGLLILQDMNDLISHLDVSIIKSVFYHTLPGTREVAEEQSLKALLPNTNFKTMESYSLLHPNDLPFSVTDTPEVFTAFRKKVEKLPMVRTPLTLPDYHQQGPLYLLPSLKSLGYEPTHLITPTDELSALKRLNYYCITSRHVLRYKETRNGMAHWDDSSKLSLYLSIGSLSPRRVYEVLKQAETTYGANESTYWLWFELLWRDFFYFTHVKEGDNFFRPWEIPKHLDSKDQQLFDAILKGETGYPLIDANMKELTQTGWMSNRGRQNVASFFTHYCKLPWALGALMFESYLMDYNVSSNTGNWRYVSGVGNDPRENRIFNVVKQGTQYDASTAYITTWLPQLKELPQHSRYHVHQLSKTERSKIEYPDPIVGLPWQ
jgi:deoxyribodipyrimidine photo-lyase